jgi:nitrite reductase (NADH) large subunit
VHSEVVALSAVIRESDLALFDAAAKPIVVVGSGPVGARAVQELSRRQPRRHIVWYGAENSEPYNRVQLSSLLVGEVNLAQITGEYQVATNSALIERRFGCPVTYIEREARCVIDGRGHRQAYSTLVLATGSSPRVPAFINSALPGVFTFRNLDDAWALAKRREDSHCTVVLGGGLLGLEAARAMHGKHTKVVVVEHSSRLMARQLDSAASTALQRHLEALGIQIVLGVEVTAVLGEQCVTGVTLADRDIACDTLIVATGVTANIELARRCGLEVGRGIHIDDETRTSDPHIHAIGECAEHRAVLYGLVAPGLEQAQVAASVIAGEQALYHGSLTPTRLKVVGVPVFSMGSVVETPRAERVWNYRSPDHLSTVRMVTRNGRLVAASAVGPAADIGRLQDAVTQQEALRPWQLFNFLRTGRAWPAQSEPSVAQWPATAMVCNCMGVTRGQLSDAIKGGCNSVETLSACTGAATGCGSCRPLLTQLLEAPQPQFTGLSTKLLLWLAGAAGLLALWLLLPGSIPYANSITTLPYDALWRDGSWKQVSGYTLLVLSALASLLAARKRLRSVRFGEFAWWRVIHVGIGVLCLGALLVHTGGRLGSGLNFLLSLFFLAPAFMGVLAGNLIAKEQQLGAGGVAQRRRWVWLHLLLLWPLPALLAFHVVQGYMF